jgi:predicted ArsR family transcriptional regulator
MLRKQLLDTSRGRVVSLLQLGGLTADDLASKLGVTTNAVREHLAGLERDGVVERAGRRPGTTRPSQVYELTAEVEQLLSQAYVPFVTELIQVFTMGLSPQRVGRLMRQVGEGLADKLCAGKRPVDLRARVTLASRLINEHLGAVTRVEENGSFVIRGAGCPLAALTGKHPSVCLAIESLVAKVVGSPVHECCDRTTRPRCGFEIKRVLSARR